MYIRITNSTAANERTNVTFFLETDRRERNKAKFRLPGDIREIGTFQSRIVKS